MSAVMQTFPERRRGTAALIDELRKERHEVWAMYCRIAELKPFSAGKKVQTRLSEFSQLLVDYVSLWHFGIYERLLSGNEKRQALLSFANELYPELSRTTDAAIVFNDKYEHAKNHLTPSALEQDLSVLGENLAIRMSLEDKLCNMLLN